VIRYLLVLLILLPSTAWGADPLAKAKKALIKLEYRRAIRLARKVERSTKSGPQDMIEAYRIQGLGLASRGKRKQATLAFRKLLALDPDFRLTDDISPKLMPAFNKALTAAEKQKPIRLIHKVPEPPKSLAGLELAVKLTGNPMKMVKAVKIRFRLGSEDEEQMIFEVSKPESFGMALPQHINTDQVSYYFVAVSRHGAELARAGSREQPYLLTTALPPAEPPKPVVVAVAPVEPEPPAPAEELPMWARKGKQPVWARKKEPEKVESTPWYKTWWFWTTVGVVVAAGATTGVVLGLQGEDGPYHYDITVE
jgi:hypothetical protein